MLGIVVFSAMIVAQIPADPYPYFYGVFALSLVYGILFVIPIGGADMPVVISLLNSFTGVAAAFGGVLYDNQVMLTGGIPVGSRSEEQTAALQSLILPAFAVLLLL